MLAKSILAYYLSPKVWTGQCVRVQDYAYIHVLAVRLLALHCQKIPTSARAKPCCLTCRTVVSPFPTPYGKLYSYCPNCKGDLIALSVNGNLFRSIILDTLSKYYTTYEAEWLVCKVIEEGLIPEK